jgi:hypothetical protein
METPDRSPKSIVSAAEFDGLCACAFNSADVTRYTFLRSPGAVTRPPKGVTPTSNV